MRLLAISDLHIGYPANARALEELPDHPDDWLIVGGDVGETEEQLRFALTTLGARFAKLFWVPGNHELWTLPKKGGPERGVERYERLVRTCRELGVHTPEDDWVAWPADPTIRIAPVFTLYDYSFAPDGLSPEDVVQWAREDGILAMDERLLHPDPYPSRAAWCAARCDFTEARLAALPEGERVVLVNHWPLRRDLVRLYRIPRYAPWCGTRRTEDWHLRFPIHAVVNGHLHMRSTDWRDGVRFEEVAVGYPRHWTREKGLEGYLREILPGPSAPPEQGWAGPEWHR